MLKCLCIITFCGFHHKLLVLAQNSCPSYNAYCPDLFHLMGLVWPLGSHLHDPGAHGTEVLYPRKHPTSCHKYYHHWVKGKGEDSV